MCYGESSHGSTSHIFIIYIYVITTKVESLKFVVQIDDNRKQIFEPSMCLGLGFINMEIFPWRGIYIMKKGLSALW